MALFTRRTLLRDADINDSTLPELMSDDMYKERLRAKWEEEERRNMEQPESHYANVQFDGRLRFGLMVPLCFIEF